MANTLKSPLPDELRPHFELWTLLQGKLTTVLGIYVQNGLYGVEPKLDDLPEQFLWIREYAERFMGHSDNRHNPHAVEWSKPRIERYLKLLENSLTQAKVIQSGVTSLTYRYPRWLSSKNGVIDKLQAFHDDMQHLFKKSLKFYNAHHFPAAREVGEDMQMKLLDLEIIVGQVIPPEGMPSEEYVARQSEQILATIENLKLF